MKINNKSERFQKASGPEIDITSKLAFKKDVQMRVNKEKIQTGKSKYEDMKNK